MYVDREIHRSVVFDIKVRRLRDSRMLAALCPYVCKLIDSCFYEIASALTVSNEVILVEFYYS